MEIMIHKNTANLGWTVGTARNKQILYMDPTWWGGGPQFGQTLGIGEGQPRCCQMPEGGTRFCQHEPNLSP